MMASIDSFSHLLSYWTKSIKHYRNMFALIGVYFVSKHLCKAVFRFYRIGYIHLWSKVRPLRIQDYGKWAGIQLIYRQILMQVRFIISYFICI